MSVRFYPYPKEIIRHRSGCKVSWNTYEKEETAREAAMAAQLNASNMECLGFDFGFCVPGEVKKVSDGWEVCIP